MTLEARKKRIAEINEQIQHIMNYKMPKVGSIRSRKLLKLKQLMTARYHHQMKLEREEKNALARP